MHITSQKWWSNADISLSCLARCHLQILPITVTGTSQVGESNFLSVFDWFESFYLGTPFGILSYPERTCLSRWLTGLRPCVKNQRFPAALSATVLGKSVNQTQLSTNDAQFIVKRVTFEMVLHNVCAFSHLVCEVNGFSSHKSTIKNLTS